MVRKAFGTSKKLEFQSTGELNRGHREGGRLGSAKNFKCHFLRDIENSFHEVTHMGLEPHHLILFKIYQQIQLLETFKILDKMDRSLQAD